MSHDAGKADQIALHFYTKLFNIIYDARATAELPERPKTDKWFNLDIPDPDLFPRDVRDTYKTLSPSSLPPPFEVQVLLCVPELVQNQVLVQLTPNSSRTRVDHSLRFILLESWRFVHSPRTPSDDDNTDIALPTIYKHAITLFRSLYSLLRLLPSWTLYKRIRRRTGGHNRNGNLSIKLRVRTGSEDDSNITVLGFGIPPSQTSPPFEVKSHAFTAIPHPMGTLALSSTYLTNPDFQLDELESLLSSRFFSEGTDFVPTLLKNQAQRSSMMTTASSPGGVGIHSSAAAGAVSSSPGAAGGRAFPPSFRSKSKSPPESIADRFLITARIPPPSYEIPATQSTTTTDQRLGTMHARHASNPTAYAPGTSTSAFPIKDDGPYSRPPSALGIARIRRESAGTGDMPNSPSASTFSNTGVGGTSTTPLPIRRPHLSGGVNPFKSNTLSSPSSLHSSSPRGSPLGGITTPGAGSTGRASPAPRVPHSPIGLGMGSPITSNRPSPPFTPSSLGDRRSNASAEGGDEGMVGPRPVPARKRYSSNFGHRYAPNASPASATGVAAAGSEGSGGSGSGMAAAMVERKDGSFLNTQTDEDDISIFVHEIDSRKPLSGRHRLDREKQQDDDVLLSLRRATLDDDAERAGDYDANDDRGDHGRQRQLSKLPLRADGSPESPLHIHDRFSRQQDDGTRRRPLAPSGLGVVIGAKVATASGSSLNPLSTPTPDSLTPRTAFVGSPPGVVLTNQADIDEKLRRMNENFFTSLEGLGSGKDRSHRSGNDSGRSGLASPSLAGHGGGNGGDGVGSAIADSAGGMGTSASGSASGSGSGSGGSDPEAVFGRKYPLGKPFVERRRYISTSESTTGSIGMGSQEVIGRMEF